MMKVSIRNILINAIIFLKQNKKVIIVFVDTNILVIDNNLQQHIWGAEGQPISTERTSQDYQSN